MASWEPTPEGITTIVTLLQTLSDPAQASKHAEGNQVSTINRILCCTKIVAHPAGDIRGSDNL
jgi:hypothetical protein